MPVAVAADVLVDDELLVGGERDWLGVWRQWSGLLMGRRIAVVDRTARVHHMTSLHNGDATSIYK